MFVVISTPEVIKQILVTDFGNFTNRTVSRYKDPLCGRGDNTTNLSSDQKQPQDSWKHSGEKYVVQ